MRPVLFFLLLMWGELGLAQTTNTSLKKLGNSGGKTWAVVIGISDYQDNQIPDLSYAHRDAEAFATWLQSPAGGGLEGDQLQVLINEKATAGRVAEALDALLELVQENDKVFIYYSGHGDVERKTFSQPGFLLCWDAPSRVYMGGGTYSLSYLQEIVTTLSLQNKAKVTVIADACRAGKLAGSQVGGPQLTSANLQRQLANEMKILSCQPDEYSLEGTQWGGGRGVFSYHLMDGLYGLADRNTDGIVTLGELDRYLEEHVTMQVAPISQVPVLLGNKTEKIAFIHEETLADITRIKSGELTQFTATDSRGIEEEVLANVDPSIRELYGEFKLAVEEKRFFTPEGNSAEEFYAKLSVVESLAPLDGIMKRNYAAALQDEAQQTLNEWLKTNDEATFEAIVSKRLPQKVFTEKVRTYPRCLDRAAELLGNQHYMYAALKARKYFFEGYLLANSNRNPNQENGMAALELFRQSLDWLPEQPHVYWQMSLVFGVNLLQPDSMEHYALMAHEVHPNWIKPFSEAAFWLSYKFRQPERSRPFLERASLIDAHSADVWNGWAFYYFGNKNIEAAEYHLKKAIGLDSTQFGVWNNLGYMYIQTERYSEGEPVLKNAIGLDSTQTAAWSNLGFLYYRTQRYAEAGPVLRKAIALDSTNYYAWNNLGLLYNQTRRIVEAEQAYQKAIALDSTHASAWINLGHLYLKNSNFMAAEPILIKAIALDTTETNAWNNLGGLYLNTRRYTEAEPHLKRAIALDSTHIGALNNLGNLYNNTRRYIEAEQVYQKAIALDSMNVATWYNLGFMYHQTHRFIEAEHSYKKASGLDSTQFLVWSNLAGLYEQTRRYPESELAYKKALALDSTNATVWNNFGWMYLQSLNYVKAESMLKKATALDSTNIVAWNNLGNVHRKTFRYIEAEAVFKKAIALDARYAPSWNNLGSVYLEQRRYNEAEEVFKQTITLAPNVHLPYKHLGMVYYKTSRPQEARQYFLKALELNPNYPGAMLGMAYLLFSEGKISEAFGYIEQAIWKGSAYDELVKDEDLASLRALPEWRVLMEKHFDEK